MGPWQEHVAVSAIILDERQHSVALQLESLAETAFGAVSIVRYWNIGCERGEDQDMGPR